MWGKEIFMGIGTDKLSSSAIRYFILIQVFNSGIFMKNKSASDQ